jgi:hypothetical protein
VNSFTLAVAGGTFGLAEALGGVDACLHAYLSLWLTTVKMRWLLPILLLALPIAAACSNETSAPEPASTLPPERLSDHEAAALDAAQAFVAAWEAGNRAALTAALSSQWLSGSGKEWVDELGGAAEVKVASVQIDRSRPAAPGTVLVGVALEVKPTDARSPWNSGPNYRFIQLANEGGAWKVTGIGG